MSDKAEDFYRDKLVDWCNRHGIPTGSEADSFDNLLEVIGTYVDALHKQRENQE
jgi:hypothetical protein